MFRNFAHHELTDKSDVDLIVDFDAVDNSNYADNYFEFKFSLQYILKRPIDVIEENAIKNH